MFLFFFFFQAEDGIRDSSVTGVQTCALPIYSLGSNGGLQPVNVSANVIGHSGKQQERVSIFATPVSKAWNTIYKNTPVSGIISPSKTNAFTPITLNSLSKSKIPKTFVSSL